MSDTEQNIPTEEVVQEETVPVTEQEETVPQQDVPVEEEAAPVQEEAAPVQEEAAPVQEEAAPAPVEEEAAPAPVEEEAAPAPQQQVEEETAVVVAADSPRQTNPQLYANALECAQSRREQSRNDQHSSNAVRYLLGISNTAKSGDVDSTHELIRALEDEDAQLFTDIPRELKPRKTPRVSDGREGSMTRRAEYYNANYSLPEKHETSSPRRLVDIRRPLTARYDPSSPAARKARSEGGASSRYNGLARGDLSCLENDPIYTPSPESRRKQIEAAKDQERSKMAKPHSAAQLARRRGPPPKEKTVAKKDADWYPALANLAENGNIEGKQRRQEAQARMSTHTFK